MKAIYTYDQEQSVITKEVCSEMQALIEKIDLMMKKSFEMRQKVNEIGKKLANLSIDTLERGKKNLATSKSSSASASKKKAVVGFSEV